MNGYVFGNRLFLNVSNSYLTEICTMRKTSIEYAERPPHRVIALAIVSRKLLRQFAQWEFITQ